MALCFFSAAALTVFNAPATAASHGPRPGHEGDLASASATYDTYIACGRARSDPPSSRCVAGDQIGAFFRSNAAAVTYSVCVTFPTGRQLCADNQEASLGTLYVNNVTTSIVGRHTVTWAVNGAVLTEHFFLDRASPPQPAQQTRVCGLLPGDGAYSYVETRGVTCRAGKLIAHRARKRFCAARNDCLITPPAPITTVYKGSVRYNGWSCRVKDGWELLVVRCRKGDMRLVQKAGA